MSWDSYNESTDLKSSIDSYKTRFGYYPESVHADAIYRTRVNRAYCKEKNIRLSGPPLGRKSKEAEVRKQKRKQEREDECARIPVEGKFGNAKRAYSLNRIIQKRKETSETTISLVFLLLNLEKVLRDRSLIFFSLSGISNFIVQKKAFSRDFISKSSRFAA